MQRRLPLPSTGQNGWVILAIDGHHFPDREVPSSVSVSNRGQFGAVSLRRPSTDAYISLLGNSYLLLSQMWCNPVILSPVLSA